MDFWFGSHYTQPDSETIEALGCAGIKKGKKI